MDNATIWIVVPVYNVEKLLPKYIRSIQQQTHTNWNLVLVDDGSLDNSGKICDNFAANDIRIKVIHAENGGPAAARKKGVDLVPPGAYCCFCDSDDELPRGALHTMYQAAVNTEADLVCGQIRRILYGIRFMPRYRMPCFAEEKTYNHEEIMRQLFTGCFGISIWPVSLCGKLYRSDVIKAASRNSDPSPQCFAEDLNLIMHVLPMCNTATFIKDVVYDYRLGGGTSKFMPTFLPDNLLMYNKKMITCKQYVGEINLPRFIAIELKNTMFTYLTMCEQYQVFPQGDLLKEIAYVREIGEMTDAITRLEDKDINRADFDRALVNKEYERVASVVREHVRRNRCKQKVKKLLSL